jgi:hypothetical protein
MPLPIAKTKQQVGAAKKDEGKAVVEYGIRAKQHPVMAPMFGAMQQDEIKHKALLTGALKGLKQATSKEKK